jgi:hypothetical protein
MLLPPLPPPPPQAVCEMPKRGLQLLQVGRRTGCCLARRRRRLWQPRQQAAHHRLRRRRRRTGMCAACMCAAWLPGLHAWFFLCLSFGNHRIYCAELCDGPMVCHAGCACACDCAFYLGTFVSLTYGHSNSSTHHHSAPCRLAARATTSPAMAAMEVPALLRRHTRLAAPPTRAQLMVLGVCCATAAAMCATSATSPGTGPATVSGRCSLPCLCLPACLPASFTEEALLRSCVHGTHAVHTPELAAQVYSQLQCPCDPSAAATPAAAATCSSACNAPRNQLC